MNKRLGESIAWAVDTLLLDESSATDGQSLKKRKQEALEAMSYVRDVLNTGTHTALDEERMFGEEESAKRKAKAQLESDKKVKAAEDPQSIYLVAPKPPAAVSVTSKPKTIGPGFRASSKSFGPSSPPAAASSSPLSSSTSYFSSPPAPLPSPSSSSTNTRFAPWNYTRSSFGGDSSLPATSLPRPPPPTSGSRPSLVGSGLVNSDLSLKTISSPKEANERPTPKRQVTPDPLGVLK